LIIEFGEKLSSLFHRCRHLSSLKIFGVFYLEKQRTHLTDLLPGKKNQGKKELHQEGQRDLWGWRRSRISPARTEEHLRNPTITGKRRFTGGESSQSVSITTRSNR